MKTSLIVLFFFFFITLLSSTLSLDAYSDEPIYWWPHPSHVVVCVLQRQSYGALLDNPEAPFFNSLLSLGLSFSRMDAKSLHASGGILQLFAGSLLSQSPSASSPPASPYPNPNLAQQISARGFSFAGFSEGLPSDASSSSVAGEYPHLYSSLYSPWTPAFFSSLPPSLNLPFSEFLRLNASGDFSSLPSLSFLVPDQCNSGALCPVSAVDTWLSLNLAQFVSWSRAHNALLVLTSLDAPPCHDAASCPQTVPLLLVGEMVPKGVVDTTSEMDHMRLSRGLSDLFGVVPYTSDLVWTAAFPDHWLLPDDALPLGCVLEEPSVLPRPDHIVVVMMENHSLRFVRDSPLCDWINSLSQQGTLFNQSYAIMHPSQPNYLHLFAADNFEVYDDGFLAFDFIKWPSSAMNLGTAFLEGGFTFAGFSEGLPYTGYQGNSYGSFPSQYQRKHVPWTNFGNIPPALNLPFTAFPTNFDELPTLSWVIPNQCNDQHDCWNANGPRNVGIGDDWLSRNLQPYITWAKTHNSMFILTYDEDGYDGPNQIFTAIVGQHVKQGFVVNQPINHHRLLRMILDMYGLPHFHPRLSRTCPFPTSWINVEDNPSSE